MFDTGGNSAEISGGPGGTADGDQGSDDGASGSGEAAVPKWAVGVGPEVIAALVEQDLSVLETDQMLDALAAWERQAAWVASQAARVLATAFRRLCGQWSSPSGVFDRDAARIVGAELAAVLRVTGPTACARAATAERMLAVLPATWQALQTGAISHWHATAVVEETGELSAGQARWVEGRVLPKAEGRTVGGLRRLLRRAVAACEPDAAARRALKGRADRHVRWWPLPDGMAELRAVGPAPEIIALFESLDTAAGRRRPSAADTGEPLESGPLPHDHPGGSEGAFGAGIHAADDRSMGARRFDTLVALAIGALDLAECPDPPTVRGAVHLTIDLPTLLGLANRPGELAGYGPLPAPLARVLAADSTWRRLITDQLTGLTLDLGRTSRFPSDALARYVRTRDRTCCFPGCNRSAWRADLDHTIAWEDGGATDADNLAALCPMHHRLKRRGWRYERLAGGFVEWTSPLKRRYVVLPDIVPDPDSAGPDGELTVDLHPGSARVAAS